MGGDTFEKKILTNILLLLTINGRVLTYFNNSICNNMFTMPINQSL